MKNRILTFIIGILLGVIITTSVFLFYNNSIDNNQNETMKTFENNGQMQRPNGKWENHKKNHRELFSLQCQTIIYKFIKKYLTKIR